MCTEEYPSLTVDAVSRLLPVPHPLELVQHGLQRVLQVCFLEQLSWSTSVRQAKRHCIFICIFTTVFLFVGCWLHSSFVIFYSCLFSYWIIHFKMDFFVDPVCRSRAVNHFYHCFVSCFVCEYTALLGSFAYNKLSEFYVCTLVLQDHHLKSKQWANLSFFSFLCLILIAPFLFHSLKAFWIGFQIPELFVIKDTAYFVNSFVNGFFFILYYLGVHLCFSIYQ